MKLLAAQSDARMDDNLQYTAAQTSALMAERRRLSYQYYIVACEKAALEDHVVTLEDQVEQLENQKVCEALRLEKGKQLAPRPATSSESNAMDPERVSEKVKEVDISLSSLVEMDFSVRFHLVELDYDSFCQFYRRPGPGSSSSDSRD
ncbi:unnamed protein product [Lactuca saligna]|uniref:Uncharacterized protein n=1 Tax=Lactuca saligna TaxID=75948 RepID=A0AA35YVY7_LACSI|nr:unnamed protein product [Lactuca saligna]